VNTLIVTIETVSYVRLVTRNFWLCVHLPVDLRCFPLTRSPLHDKVIFTVLSVRVREAAEFRDYSLVAISVFCNCMF
jgi:hypothetical protein